MAVRDDFAAGEVLAAADLNDTFASKVDYALPTNAQTGTTYTFVAADAEKLTTASNGSAVTLTIPPASSVAWPDNTVLRVVNYGAGAVTVAGGSGVTVTNTATTLGQYEAAAAIRTGSDAWTLVPFGSKAAAPSSVEYLVIAGGGGGGARGGVGAYGAGGGAGGYRCSVSGESSGGGASAESAFSVTANTSYTVTVGAGGSSASANSGNPGGDGSASSFSTVTTVGGGGGGANSRNAGATGGSGGGSVGATGGLGTANEGYDGGDGQGSGYAGGGGGAGGAGADSAGSAERPGGIGVSSSITGSATTRAVGGVGGSNTIGDGAANSGTGGTGSATTGNRSGSGGKGVVIVRQALSDSDLIAATSGASVSITATHIIYTFNDSGTIEWAA